MADDQVTSIMTSGPDTPCRCATPFFFANLAAAKDYVWRQVSRVYHFDRAARLATL